MDPIEVNQERHVERKPLRLPVLLYHRVARDSGSPYPTFTVSPERFEIQLKWLISRGFKSIHPSDWLAWRDHGKPLPSRPVVLAFDDAHASLPEHAFPLLERHGFTAGVFVATGFMGRISAWDQGSGWGPFPLMPSDQIREWAARGIEFGAHSRTHRDLTRLSGSELDWEIGGSRDDLAAVLGANPVSFAYPFGCYNDSVLASARRFFALAFTAKGGVNTFRTDPHLLRRTLALESDSQVDLEFRTRLGWTPGEVLRWGAARSARFLRPNRK